MTMKLNAEMMVKLILVAIALALFATIITNPIKARAAVVLRVPVEKATPAFVSSTSTPKPPFKSVQGVFVKKFVWAQ